MNILELIGRKEQLFDKDIHNKKENLSAIIKNASFLVLGGAGTIGQAVSKEIFKRNPHKLHVVDISENNLVELVRDLRSTYGYIDGDFKTYALDIGSVEYTAFLNNEPTYDYVLNLSALKHVRSEKDPFTLMRMIDVNISNTHKSIKQAIQKKTKKYFCVSTDKAANPVNMMGASKRIMEMFLIQHRDEISISMARFANVAFSDGSLLHSFNQRILKRQPIVAPNDVKRYFVTPQEAGELCLMSCIYGDSGEIFIPKLDENLHLVSFAKIAENYLHELGYEPYECASEEEARTNIEEKISKGKWPCYFTSSDTTGEKHYEEFYTAEEKLDMDSFQSIGIIKNEMGVDVKKLQMFENKISDLRKSGNWSKTDIVQLFHQMIPNFDHKETGKYLDSKM